MEPLHWIIPFSNYWIIKQNPQPRITPILYKFHINSSHYELPISSSSISTSSLTDMERYNNNLHRNIHSSQSNQKRIQQCTFGRYTDNRACASEPGTSAKSIKAESTGAVNLRLSVIVRRIARPIRRTSFVYEPVSISDAISFKSINPKYAQNYKYIKGNPRIRNRSQRNWGLRK